MSFEFAYNLKYFLLKSQTRLTLLMTSPNKYSQNRNYNNPSKSAPCVLQYRECSANNKTKDPLNNLHIFEIFAQ